MTSPGTNGVYLEPVVVPSSTFLSSAKVSNPKGCGMEIDKTLDAVVLVMKGDVSSTRVQIPPEDRPLSSLRLRYVLATLQVKLTASDHFALELTVAQSAVQRTKVIIGTQIREPRQDLSFNGIPTARLPLVIPRNRWVQVVFHVAGIVTNMFGMAAMQTIESVALCGTARVGTLKVSNSEQACIDSTPDGIALFAVPAYTPPVWSTARQVSPLASEERTNDPTLRQNGGTRRTHPQLSSPRCSPRNSPNGNLELGAAGRILSVDGLLKGASVSRGSAQPVPARLEPISESALKSPLVSQSDVSDQLTYARPSPAAHPSSQPSASPPVSGAPPQALRPMTMGAVPTDQRPYVRLVSSASPRQGPPIRSYSMCGNRRSESGDAQRRDSAPDGDTGWWDGVGGWESDDCRTPTPAPAARTLPKQNPERSEGRFAPRASVVKPKPKASAETERVQRLVAARKRKVGPSNNPKAGSTPPAAEEESGSPSPPAGNGGTARSRRGRARRRAQILRANERQVARMAMAKMLVPSEIPLRQLPIKIDVQAETEEASSPNSLTNPKYGYGFGYMGILHEGGNYEEEDGADLKGAWTLAVSDDDE